MNLDINRHNRQDTRQKGSQSWDVYAKKLNESQNIPASTRILKEDEKLEKRNVNHKMEKELSKYK